ncbi:MAG: hypothetical protein ACR2MO_01505 [Acidimicrobiales bacterium]
MKKLVVGAVVVLVLGGIGAFALLSGDDDDDGEATGPSTTTSSSTAFDDTTTSSTTAAAATNSTTAAVVTTTTAKPSTTTTKAAGSTTTTGVVAACGSGTATVSFTAKDLTTDALSSTFTPQVTVDNQVNNPIEVDEASVEITYPNGETRTVRFTTAGTVIGPGTSASFTSDRLTSAQRYSSVRFTRFAYFTAGKKANCLVATP